MDHEIKSLKYLESNGERNKEIKHCEEMVGVVRSYLGLRKLSWNSTPNCKGIFL